MWLLVCFSWAMIWKDMPDFMYTMQWPVSTALADIGVIGHCCCHGFGRLFPPKLQLTDSNWVGKLPPCWIYMRRHICIRSHFLKFLNRSIIYSQCHENWLPCDARKQGIKMTYQTRQITCVKFVVVKKSLTSHLSLNLNLNHLASLNIIACDTHPFHWYSVDIMSRAKPNCDWINTLGNENLNAFLN